MRLLLRREINESGFSEAARRLWLELERRGITQTEAEVLLGVAGTGQVNRFLYGERKPGRAMTERIREAFGIASALWDAAPVEPFAPPGARAAPDPDAPIPFVLADKA